LQFQNVPDLLVVRRAILPVADTNRKKMDAMDAYAEVVQYALFNYPDNRANLQFDDDIEEGYTSRAPILDAIEHIIDAREWDVPYHIRVAIDQGTSPCFN
jgi:DNA polymerase epsilon subunit 1